ASDRSSPPRRCRRGRRRSTRSGCARSSRVCWPTRRPTASRATKSSASSRVGSSAPIRGAEGAAMSLQIVRRGGSGEINLPTPRTNVVALLIFVGCFGAGLWLTIVDRTPIPVIVGTVTGLVLMKSPRVAQQWERAVVLRLGRFIGLQGPGLFWIIPLMDAVDSWIDQRTITTSFAAEQTLTSDTVPVNVDAVLFWMVHDAQKAALEVQDYEQAVSWAAQTALRDIIGRTALTDLLRGREKIETELQQLIDARSNPWGITVQSVEMRDVVIPSALQDAMSREAQAAREKQARIILGQAEVEIANSFQQAAKSYRDNPTALHLRAMNMLYEGLKEKGALMLVPSSAVESMGMGGLMGAAALQQQKLTGSDNKDVETTDRTVSRKESQP